MDDMFVSNELRSAVAGMIALEKNRSAMDYEVDGQTKIIAKHL